MGLAFTIDSPIKVARFGISSVMSIIEDKLVETMRRHYYKEFGEPYQMITSKEKDFRAKRITDYLNLVNRIVKKQVADMQKGDFIPESDTTKYFELLPDDSKLKALYQKMLQTSDKREKESLEVFLKQQIIAGNIDVNIMTKLDKPAADQEIANNSDALSALRGYALSGLRNSSIVLSAGLNPNLFNYIAQFKCFKPDALGHIEKKIILKVSDYRSALIQGKFLAKKGIWVSEYRIESGLNCGGHAFATSGNLMGPILEEFKTKRTELALNIFEVYKNAILLENQTAEKPLPIKITVQGGIGTFDEDTLLREYFGADATGWGSPFLMVPEATTVDTDTLDKLGNAIEQEVVLSKNSPLGVRFNYLKGTTSDLEKQERIAKGSPGSPCTEKHLVMNTEFTEQPICTASKKYQKLKLEQLAESDLSEKVYEKAKQDVLDVECLCVGLSNPVVKTYAASFVKGLTSVTVCPGPNIAYFSRKVSLKEMVDHIYGRGNVIDHSRRPHMFIKELTLYVDYFQEQIEDIMLSLDPKQNRKNQKFHKEIKAGVDFYRNKADEFFNDAEKLKVFLADLKLLEARLDELNPVLA